jgi:hypothetical protein
MKWRSKMTNEWQSHKVENLISTITVNANRLEVLKKYSDSRDLTDEEIQEYELCHNVLSKASDALRIKLAY